MKRVIINIILALASLGILCLATLMGYAFSRVGSWNVTLSMVVEKVVWRQ